MAQEYSEGQRLKGSDGNVYVVHGGVPVIEQEAPPIPGGMIIRKPADPYRAREQSRKDEDQDIQRAGLGLSQQNAQRSAASDAISNPQTLRKEYSSLPEVKEYRIASQMAASALNTAANPQGDVALTYAFAKAMDPGSVVRDQEQNNLSNSQPWLQSIAENVKKQFGMDGAGSFTPQARAAIRQEIMRALATRKPLYDARRSEMAQLAQANGLRPEQIVGKNDIEVFAPTFRSYAQKNGDQDGVISALIGGEPIKAQGPALGGPPMRPAGMGATEGATPIPKPMQEAHAKYLKEHWGKVDPQDYAAFRVNLDRQYGFGTNPEGYAKSVPDINKLAARGPMPGGIAIPAVRKELSGVDQFRNNLLSDQYGAGAGVAAGLNAAGLGIPSLFAPEQTQALRDANPVASFVGDIGGGVVGTGIAGGILRGATAKLAPGAAATALRSPLAADIAYGGTFGATQADDPLYGAAGGATAAFLGNRAGRAIGGVLPAIGVGKAVSQADAIVPTSQQLRQQASSLYDAAEATGEQIGGPETFALADRFSNILRQEGRLTPKDNLTEVQPKVREAYRLVNDFAGEPMSPKQVQAARGLVGDATTSGDNAERRIGRMLLNDFDQWTDAAAPELASGLANARGVASRYLQGDEIALARDLADVRTGQFSNSGRGNALRTDFRQLDRKIAKGDERFSPPVEEAVADVARGTPAGNFFRNIGRFAPTGPVSALPTVAAMAGGGAAAGTPGILAGLALGGAAHGAREIGQRITNRSAQVAENLAYSGPEYRDLLNAAIQQARIKGGHGGAATVTAIARQLADMTGY